MKLKIWTLIVKTAASLAAMVFVWLLARNALAAGIDGAVFFSAVAIISGLGGYEAKNIFTSLHNIIPKAK